MLELEADDFDTHAGQRRLMDDDPPAFQDAFNDYAARFSL